MPKNPGFADEEGSREREAARKRSLGELGELFALKALVDMGYEKIRNLNDDKQNHLFADLRCEKEGRRFVVSVKARNKYTINGQVNTRYRLGANVYQKAREAELRHSAEACWMAIQFDDSTYSVYFGSMEDLQGSSAIPIALCEQRRCGSILVKDKRHYFDFTPYRNTLRRERKEKPKS